MKSLRSSGTRTAPRAARRSSSDPPNRAGSVRTESAAAPAASYSTARAGTSSASLIEPLLGLRRLSSAITATVPPRSAAANDGAGPAAAADISRPSRFGTSSRTRASAAAVSSPNGPPGNFHALAAALISCASVNVRVPLLRALFGRHLTQTSSRTGRSHRRSFTPISGTTSCRSPSASARSSTTSRATGRSNGYAPSFEEIAEQFNYNSLATVHEHLSNLERKGYIKRSYNESRAIEILTSDVTPQAVELPCSARSPPAFRSKSSRRAKRSPFRRISSGAQAIITC